MRPRTVRKALGEVVYAQNQAGEGPVPGETAYALAEAGFRLFNYLLPSEDETARKVRRWLEELRKQSGLNALEIVVEEQSADPRHFVSIPWNLVYDERPAKHKPAFQTGKSTERWRPFWSIRYNLTSGRRVEPLKRLPIWSDPRVIVVVDPDVHEDLNDDQKATARRVPGRGRPDERPAPWRSWRRRSRKAIPGSCTGWATRVRTISSSAAERIAPSDLRNLLRSFDDRERPEGMLAFLNCCQTAEAGQTGSFLDVLHSFGFTGAIATEQQTIDNFANEFGLAFLRGLPPGGSAAGRAAARAPAVDGPAGPALRRPLPARDPREGRRRRSPPPPSPRSRRSAASRASMLQAPGRGVAAPAAAPAARAARSSLIARWAITTGPTAPCSPAATPTSSGSPPRSTGPIRGS